MPKDTFYNLSEEKRRKIFDAAVKEFSKRRFSEASINQIIKTAGIPRGSFYQYFNDKEDIFLYMLDKILKEKREVIQNSKLVDWDADIFEICIQATRASFHWGRAKPQYNRIGMLIDSDDSEFIRRIITYYTEELGKLVERDKKRGIIKSEIDTEIIVDMIYAIYVKEYFWAGMDEDTFFKKLSDVTKVIREGVSVT